jgi:hypothetical protein
VPEVGLQLLKDYSLQTQSLGHSMTFCFHYFAKYWQDSDQQFEFSAHPHVPRCSSTLRSATVAAAAPSMRTAKISADLDRMHPTEMTGMALPSQ